MATRTQRKEPTFVAGCVSAGLGCSVAEIATHPLETIKVRLQVQGEGLGRRIPTTGGLMRILINITKEEGVLALYNGLGAAVQRQLPFGAIRVGCYDAVKLFYMDLFQEGGEVPVSSLNVGLRMVSAVSTCCIGILATQPMDVVKLRMQAMKTGPGVKPRYSGSRSAYVDIFKKEGLRGWWKGTYPNMTRTVVVSVAELVTYDLIKETILRRRWMEDTWRCHFVSAVGAGVVATIVSSPVDVIKTRIMNSGIGVYKGTFHCARIMFKDEGIRSFYKGVLPYYLRAGSWNIIMFVGYERFKKISVDLGCVQ